ncbi:MAG TPA: hypothetical protein VGL97_25505 [Bryobacteraceae bacterium]
MTPQQQALVRRILESRYFSNTVILGRILQFVCENTANTDRSLKEYEIALEVLQRPESFDPKLDPVVRVSMKSIRERLHAYFDNEGLHEDVCVSIPKGHYRAQFSRTERSPAAPATEEVRASSLERFWRPYLAERSNLLLHTEPLFFRDGRGNYIRNLYLNDPSMDSREIADRLGCEADSIQPCFHYLSAGEVHCVFSLMRLFHDLGKNLQIVNSRLSSWNETRHSNLILIGSTRTNRFMDALQEQSDFVLTDEEIRNLSPRENEQNCYRGYRYRDGKLHRFSEYALITRRQGATPGSSVTVIASNHGRAIEGVGNFLTLGGEIAKLLARMELDRAPVLPDRFQVLVRVDMIDLDDEVVNVEYVSHRTGASAGTLSPAAGRA